MLILSPQGWGDCFVAKHNYAVALAGQGNAVTFVDPPSIGSSHRSIFNAEGYKNIQVFHYSIPRPVYISSFKFRPVYNYYIERNVVHTLSKMKTWDELWCFDPGCFRSLGSFNAKKKILFIVDKPGGNHLDKLARSADAVVSIADDILQVFRPSGRPELLLDHGLSASFAAEAIKRLTSLQNDLEVQRVSLKVGYVGNLLKGSILDKEAVRKITNDHPGIEFHFWGPYTKEGNNLGGTINEDAAELIRFLQNQPNVTLHGSRPQTQLAKEIQGMDAFIIPHNHAFDINKGSNLHKIIEYLSTGKVIISTTIGRYINTGLLETCNSIGAFPKLFNEVVSNLDHHNSKVQQATRIKWALQHTYDNNIRLVRDFVYN